MSRKRVAAALALVLGVGWWLSPSQSPPTFAPPAAAPASGDPIREMPQPPAVSASSAAVVSGAQTQSLRSDFAQANDLRSFAMRARQRPEIGGLYYARLAANLCTRDTTTLLALAEAGAKGQVAQTGTISPDRLAAVDRYSQRCASFTPGEATELYAAVNAQAAAQDADPLIRNERDFKEALRAGAADRIAMAARNALTSGDPALISSLEIPARLAQDRSSGDVWLDGVKYDDDKGRGLLQIALQLGACSPDSYCIVDDMMMNACLARGVCASTREDYFVAEFGPLGYSASDFDRAKQLAARVRSAISQGAVEAFAARR